MIIHNPAFRPDEAALDLLNGATLSELTGSRSPISARERVILSERIAVEATMALLEPLRKVCEVHDANLTRRNQPGYDVLVGGRVRLQIKGGTYIESIGWTHKQKVGAADMGYDFLIFVDVGVTLDSRIGRLAKHAIPTKRHVDFYVVPQPIVMKWVSEPLHSNARGVHLYLYKRPVRTGCREDLGQTRQLAAYRNRFDSLEAEIFAG